MQQGTISSYNNESALRAGLVTFVGEGLKPSAWGPEDEAISAYSDRCSAFFFLLFLVVTSASWMHARLVFGPCVFAAAYAAVVNSARHTGMRWLICTCRLVLGGNRGLLWASPDDDFPSCRSLLANGYRSVSHLPTNVSCNTSHV